MQIIFIGLLIGVLAVSVISFTVMGLGRRRRINALARHAHEMQMRFSPNDPFDVPHRYARFALVACGHNTHALNVTHGRMASWAVRAFDFRYELGHGTRRVTRHYGVVVVETDSVLPPVLLWHEKDLDAAPLAADRCRRQVAAWRCDADTALGRKLAEAIWPLAESDASVQSSGSALMICLPDRTRRGDYTATLAGLGDLLAGLADVAGETGADVIFPPGGPLQSAPDHDTNPLRLESGPELGKKG